MKSETELPEVQGQSTNLLQVISQAVANPLMDVDKMAKLLDVHERIVADQRRTAFFAAMARVAPMLPEIGKHGAVAFTDKKGVEQARKYARLEDIDRAIRPIISVEGLSLSFDSAEVGGKVQVTCRLSHSEGHSETKTVILPLDQSGSKNGAQAVISTISYGRRILTKMFFNLIEAGEDTDGNDPTTISEEQERTLTSLMEEVGADVPRFLAFMKVAKASEILASKYGEAVKSLEAKRRAGK